MEHEIILESEKVINTKSYRPPECHKEEIHNEKFCIVYLDDFVVFGPTLEEHNNNLMILFERLRLVGLKLQAVREFREPRNIVEVQSFLGLTGYYRKFIKNISALEKPFTELTKKENIFDWTTDCQKAFDT